MQSWYVRIRKIIFENNKLVVHSSIVIVRIKVAIILINSEGCPAPTSFAERRADGTNGVRVVELEQPRPSGFRWIEK
ncbi:hypothetical protein PRIPAC_91569 [Pristionchus pacificus]|uniref:Uncharacterized protein n=1 Tax=Pristionchus pacificus TaxID=54126 RepID=A0A2A6CD00_PRIPA|nr:hypothetical protein PRIPAC_91569 [Pristionchus pacificus]|eukprot:PDM75996.1 hypothetical protein PRIPAC_39600 [Pristionchus pacificus]